MTFEEMCAERDPLYAATVPVGAFEAAVRLDRAARDPSSPAGMSPLREMALLALAISALRNQGEPYYHV